jgi:YidC/Oxa1 family membrane protein insertase
MSRILKPLVELLHWVLVAINDALASIGLSRSWTWGLAIIGITIIVRLIMFPLTWKQYKSSRAMQALAPHIKELQKKYKGDRAKLQQETMKLYQEHRVNPFASCLPLILQLPVFFALYWTIKGTDYLPKAETLALSTAPFLWMPHLGKPDPYYILLIIYIATQMISTELMLTPQTDRSQKMMMRAMPLIFVFVLKGFPSGLFVYWVTTNLWTIGQQLLIRRTMPIVALEAAAGSSGGKGGKAAPPPPKKRGRFMAAMMAAQEQRQAQVEERRKGGSGGGTGGGSGAKKGAAKGGSAGKPSGKQGGKKGGKRPPPGKGASARPKPSAPAAEIDDDKPPYR